MGISISSEGVPYYSSPKDAAERAEGWTPGLWEQEYVRKHLRRLRVAEQLRHIPAGGTDNLPVPPGGGYFLQVRMPQDRLNPRAPILTTRVVLGPKQYWPERGRNSFKPQKYSRQGPTRIGYGRYGHLEVLRTTSPDGQTVYQVTNEMSYPKTGAGEVECVPLGEEAMLAWEGMHLVN